MKNISFLVFHSCIITTTYCQVFKYKIFKVQESFYIDTSQVVQFKTYDVKGTIVCDFDKNKVVVHGLRRINLRLLHYHAPDSLTPSFEFNAIDDFGIECEAVLKPDVFIRGTPIGDHQVGTFIIEYPNRRAITYFLKL